jgi:hypothetical protein
MYNKQPPLNPDIATETPIEADSIGQSLIETDIEIPTQVMVQDSVRLACDTH